MKQTLSPEDLAKIFKDRDINPDRTHIGNHGSVRAWSLNEGYLIEYGDASNMKYYIWRDAEALELWLERPTAMDQRVREALETADRLLQDVNAKVRDEMIKLTLPPLKPGQEGGIIYPSPDGLVIIG